MFKKSIQRGLDQLVEDSRSLWVPNSIREYSSLSHPVGFLRDHVSQSVPCVWRGAAKNWAATAKWKDQNQQYLRNKVGDRVVEVAWTPDGRADSIVDVVSCDGTRTMVFAMPQQRKQNFGDVLDEMCCDRKSGGIAYYSAQDSSLSRDMPELLEDIDESVIEFAVEAFGEEACAKNIWVGDGRSVTAMHADPFENMYGVVTGVKVFRLRPPCDAAVLHKPVMKRARWTTMTDDSIENRGRVLQTKVEYEGWVLIEEEGETSWIDEGRINEGCGRDVMVRVEAGDLLYLPALWCKFFIVFDDVEHC